MSDKKYGVIGDRYEHRKNGKVGTLADYDAENNLIMILTTGEEQKVSAGTFKSFWRKYKESDVVIGEEDTPVEADNSTEVLENVAKSSEPSQLVPISKGDFIGALTELNSNRKYEFTASDNSGTLIVDDVLVAEYAKNEGYYTVTVLPDIFTESDLKYFSQSVNFATPIGKHAGVCVSIYRPIEDILCIIVNAVAELNLYGYKEFYDFVVNEE